MHRLLVALLAALDAVIAAAGGVAIVLAPLTLLWVVGLGSAADWAALWPASGAIWQLGHLVPLAVELPAEYLNLSGIDPAAASFTLSLGPLALAAFTALFAARSGRRAAQAGAAATGAVTGALVFTAIAVGIGLTTANALAAAELWQAILFPALVFGLPAMAGAFDEAWRLDEHGAIAGLRARVERGRWGAIPALVVRGTAMALTGLVGIGAAVAGVAVLLQGGEVVALFEAAHVNVVGAIVLALAQLAYLPTLVVWALSFVAGPGFALGTGTAVSPAGTQLGVLPGIPVLGAVPESSSTWLLLLALLPVAVGVMTGWMLRSRLAAQGEPSIPGNGEQRGDGGFAPRLVLAVSVAALTGAAVALLAAMTSGSIGPGRLSQVGPEVGPLACTVGIEVLVGAAILLLLPRRAGQSTGVAGSGGEGVSGSAVPDRSAATVAGLDAWQRLAAEGAFSPPPRAHPATDPWQAPGDPGDRAPAADPGPASAQRSSPADPDATEPIPGFERGTADHALAGRSEDPAPEGEHGAAHDLDATEPIPGFERAGERTEGERDGSATAAGGGDVLGDDPATGDDQPRR